MSLVRCINVLKGMGFIRGQTDKYWWRPGDDQVAQLVEINGLWAIKYLGD